MNKIEQVKKVIQLHIEAVQSITEKLSQASSEKALLLSFILREELDRFIDVIASLSSEEMRELIGCENCSQRDNCELFNNLTKNTKTFVFPVTLS